MGQTDRRAGVFYQKVERWKAELELLREILLASPLDEAFKWRHPCYVWKGRNLAMPAGYVQRCVLSFFNGVLLEDPDGLLAPPGKNSRAARVMEFHSVAEIEVQREAIEGFIAAAIRAEDAGKTIELPKDDLDYPAELTEALEADAPLLQAWEVLTPGRQRGWVLHFTGAKQAETRKRRIAKAVPQILAGKGMHDK